MKSAQIITVFSALAQDSRLAIFRLLTEYGEEGLCARDIGEKLKIPKNTLSFHMLLLTQAGLVNTRKDGTYIFYSVNFESINTAVAFLLKHCCRKADAKTHCKHKLLAK